MSLDEERSFMPARQKPPHNGRGQADLAYYDNVESIRASLEEIAKLAKFVRIYTPYVIGGIGILYPTFGKIVQAVAQAHGVN